MSPRDTGAALAKRNAKIEALFNQGLLPPVIAQRVGISANSVRLVLRKLNNHRLKAGGFGSTD